MRGVMVVVLWAVAALLAAGEPTISFKKSTESIVESAGQLELELDAKFLPKNGSVSVTWRAVAGTALPGYDFVAASGTAVVADKDKKPTIAIALIDDLANTGNRQFSVELVSATGATLGSTAQAAVTVVEDDTALPPAQVEVPVVAPAAGVYGEPVVATATTATPGAELRYRLDGAEPTVGDPLLPSAGLTIDRSATLTVRGFYPRWLPSAVASAAYTFVVAPVTASLPAGTYTGVQSVTLASATAGAEIRYTLDGTTPGPTSALAAGAIELPGSVTLKAVALRDGWSASPVFSAAYTLRVVTPTLDPTPGTYGAPMTIAAAVADTQAELRYTLDGSTPTSASALWPVGGVAIDRTTAVRVRAFRAGWAASAVAGGTYTLRVAAVTADPKGGTYTGSRTISLATTTPASVIRYTLDGTVPTAASPIYTTPIELTGSTTVRAVASRDGWRNSPVLRAVYTLRVPTPVLSPAAGTYAQSPTITASVSDAQAVLRYTIDGTTPTVASPVLPAAGLTLAGTATVRVIATRDGWANSAVVRASYTLRNATPVASLPAGTYTGAQQVTLSSASPGAVIRYTLDGTTPTATSPLADGPVLIEGNKTLRAIAMQPSWSNSPTLRVAYALRVPAPQPTPAAGPHPAWPLVTAASSDALATVRYTTGATVPSARSPLFPTAGLQLSAPTTLNLVATRSGWTVSLPTAASYTRDLPPVAGPVSASTDEDTAVSIAPSASDADSATLTWSIVTPPSYGVLSGFDAATGAATYTPAADWNGSDGYTLAVADALTTVAVPVTVAVAAVDDAAVIAAPSGGSAPVDADLQLGAFAVSDIDSPLLSLAVSVDAGTLSLPAQPASGATWAAGVLSGSPAEVAAALTGAVWRAPSAPGTATLTIAGNGASANVALSATAPGAPIAIAPLAATTWTSAPHGTQILPQPAQFWNIDVAASGRYHLWVNGSASAALAVEVDGVASGAIALPTVANWSCRDGQGLAQTVNLSAGVHRITLVGDGAVQGLILVAETPTGMPHDDPIIVGPGTVAVIEAEDYDAVSGVDGHAWLPVSVAGTSGSAVRSLPDVNVMRSIGAGETKGLGYDVYFTAPGSYQVWTRARGDQNGDSVHIGLNGTPAVTGQTLFSETSFFWSGTLIDKTACFITVPSAGVHRLNLWFREDGIIVDQLAISGVVGWTPPREDKQPAFARAQLAQQSASGTVIFEAESCHQATFMTGGQQWQVGAIADAVGQSLRLTPDRGWFYSSTATDLARSPMAVWYVHFSAAGTYDVWLRAAGPDANGDSFHLGLNGQAVGAADMTFITPGAALPWSWSGRRSTGVQARLSIPSAGVHAVNLWMREDGAAVDRILIQTVGAPAPTGTGPVASPLGGLLSGNG